MGLFEKKKKGMLPKNGGAIGPSGPATYKEPPMPKRVSIEEAKNGFTINCSGGKDGYSSQPSIAETLDKAMEVAAAHFGGKKAAKDGEKKEGDKDA